MPFLVVDQAEANLAWGEKGKREWTEKREKQEKGRIVGGWTSHVEMACLGYVTSDGYGAIRR